MISSKITNSEETKKMVRGRSIGKKAKITNSEETKKMVRGRSIGKKARKAPHQAQTPNTVQQIPKNTRMNNKKKFDKNKKMNTKILKLIF